jgi:poly(beta-D-mannuronate) lyase
MLTVVAPAAMTASTTWQRYHVPNSGGVRIIGEDHIVINNYISGCSGSSLKHAITIMDGIPNTPLNGYYRVKRALVAFNTLVDNRYNINIGGGKDNDNTLPPQDCVIANNLVYGTDQPLVTPTDTADNLTWQGNLFYGSPIGLPAVPQGIIVSDPRLAPAGPDGIRHLSSASPAINSSSGDYPMVIHDMDGQERDSLKDVGADEYSDGEVFHRPLNPTDVGPVTGGTAGVQDHSGIPVRTGLGQNWPNPFNPRTAVSYELRERSSVSLKVYDILGKEVTTLVNGVKPAGTYTVLWDAGDHTGGVYFCRMSAGIFSDVRKMILMR